MEITIEIEVEASLNDVWNAWITPEDIIRWNFAVDDWHCPSAEIDFTVGGKFNYRMEAKDGSMGFDFKGEFTKIEPNNSIHFKLEDNRAVKVVFIASENSTKVVETFDAEDENSGEQQRKGWLGILGNFKRHVEHTSN